MTKKNIDARKEVVVHGVADLQLGDRIAFKATLGESTRMNTSFTFGGIDSGNYLVSEDGKRIVTINTFLKNIDGWDNTEWHVWRKIVKLPGQGEIIYVNKITGTQAAGLFINRGNGCWQGIRQPDIKIAGKYIESWSKVEINYPL